MTGGVAEESLDNRYENVPEQLRPHCFKPGNCANPGGRPKGRTLMSVVRELLSKPNGDETELYEVAHAFIGAMKDASYPHLREYVEREEGKTPDKVQTDAKVELVVRLDPQLKEWAE